MIRICKENLVLDYLDLEVIRQAKDARPCRSNLLIGAMHSKDVGQYCMNQVAALDGTLLFDIGVSDAVVAVDDVVLHGN